MCLGGEDDVIAIDDPVMHQLLDEFRRMLAVAIHEQHGAFLAMIEAGHQRGFLAEIARQRNHLHVDVGCGQGLRDLQRVIAAAVIDIDDLGDEAVTRLERAGEMNEFVVKRGKAGRFVIAGHDQRQALCGRSLGVRGKVGDVTAQHHQVGILM